MMVFTTTVDNIQVHTGTFSQTLNPHGSKIPLSYPLHLSLHFFFFMHHLLIYGTGTCVSQ